MKASVTNVVAVVLALWVGRCFAPAITPVVITRVDTVPYAAFRDTVANLRLESEGLRAKLAGRSSVRAVTIVRTDTLVLPPDTVLQLVSMSDDGTLSVAPLVRVDTLWAPELHRFDIADCDDGFSWAAGELVCDRARLGHLGLYATVGASYAPFVAIPNAALNMGAGIEWTPSYRSPWRASLEMAPTGRVALAIARKWQIW